MITTGWIDDPRAAEAYAASLPFSSLSQFPEIRAANDNQDFFHFDSEAEYLKRLAANAADALQALPTDTIGQTIYLKPNHQLTNDCTAHGLGGALQDSQCVRIVLRGEHEELKLIATEPLYGGGIVTIMKTRGDNGAWTSAPIQYGIDFGFLERKPYGTGASAIDLSVYDSRKATEYSKKGVPSTLLEPQRLHLIRTVLPIKTYEDGDALLRQGYPIVGGSNQGFSTTRDKDGFCNPKGSWAHCTRYRGRRTGKKPGWAYGQSWGPGMPGGPSTVTLDNGRSLDLPEGTFFVDPDTITSMLRRGEFYAISDIVGFALLDYKFY